ncbi:hypothetical protein Tco_0421587 [Tanacetum coccineum]
MSTHEQHTPTVPTSTVRNTGGRSGPQRLEEPTPDEARLLYGNETGRNQRNHEESHYSESKTPTARTEPRRRYENRRSRSPTPVASVFKRLKQNRPPSPRPRPRKEGGVFNRLGGKERSASARSDGRHQSFYEKEIEMQLREHHHRGTSSWETGGYSESEDGEGCHWKSKSRRHSHVKTYDGSGDPEDHLKLFQAAAKTERWAMPTWCHIIQGKLSPTNKTHQGSGGDTSYQAKRWRIHGGLYGKIQSINPGCGRSAGMHEDLRIHARYNPPRADQAFIRENSEVNGRNVQGDYVFSARGSCRIQS